MRTSGLEGLTAYLAERLSSGEQVELWNIWSGARAGRTARSQGSLKNFEVDTLQHNF